MLSAAFVLALAAVPAAQTQQVAVDRPETATPPAAAAIVVTSAAIKADGVIPLEFSRYGRNLAPPVAWSGAPRATKSYVLLFEDPDSRPALNTHWLGWNIPGVVGGLSRGTKNGSEPEKPEGMRQGPNLHGSLGYSGPYPPVGDPPHHYHLEVLALDRTLGLHGGADKERVLRAIRGHVLAKGEVVGLYSAPPPVAPKPAPSNGVGGEPGAGIEAPK